MAYVENNKIEFSAIFLPELNELYYADNTGTYRNNEKIQVSVRTDLSQSIFRISQGMLRRVIPDVNKRDRISRSIGAQLNFYTGGYSFPLCASGSIEGDIFYPNTG